MRRFEGGTRPGPRVQYHRAPPPNRVEPAGWKSLGGGFVLAVIFVAVPLLRFILGYLGTIAHELGHTVAYWLHGYPAVPAFDFLFGGGITISQERSRLLQLAVIAILGGLIYLYRHNRTTLVLLLVLTALHILFGVTPLHQGIIAAAGHLAELLIAGIFLYRAIKGSAITHAVERPLYAALGFFLVFRGVGLAHGLITNRHGFRIDYAEGKGGYIRPDFYVLAEDFFHTGIEVPALLFLGLCAATPVLAFVFFQREATIARWLNRILRRAGS